MKKETLKRIFDFLENKGEHKAPFMWKLINNEPLTKKDLNVKGDLDLSNSNITLLPEGLKVGGSLLLDMTRFLKSLPKGLKVFGYLDLSYSGIKSLPEDLEVSGELNLTDTELTSLPKGLKVGGNLDTTYTPLTKYSDEELREMIQPGFIKGEIYR